MSEYEDATALVVEALLDLPGFEWDDQDVINCAHTAVMTLEAAGWGPREPSDQKETGP